VAGYKYRAAAAAASGMTTLDLSLGTEANTAMKHGDTTLGSTSTLVVAATHGLIDAALDCYINLQIIDAAPAGKSTLHAVLTVPTAPTEDPGGSYASLSIVVAPDASLAVTEGYHVSLTQTGTPTQRIGACERIGTAPTATAPNLGVGPYTTELFAYFNGTEARGALGVAKGASDELPLAELTAATGTFTDVYLGVALGQKGASPASEVTWADCTLEYHWI